MREKQSKQHKYFCHKNICLLFFIKLLLFYLLLSTYFILLLHFSLCFYDNVNFTINVNVISQVFYGIIFHCWSTPISTQLALHNHFIIVSSDGDGVLSPHTDTIMIPLLTDYVTAIQKTC